MDFNVAASQASTGSSTIIAVAVTLSIIIIVLVVIMVVWVVWFKRRKDTARKNDLVMQGNH